MGLFEKFENISHQDWLDKITIDLKGKNFKETLVWKTAEGIDVQPFYTRTPEEFISTPIKVANHWMIRETIFISSFEVANQKALLALKGGANSILFIGKINTPKEMDILLKDIQTEIIELHFYNSTPQLTSSLITPNKGSISYDVIGEQVKSKTDTLNQHIEILAEVTSINSSIKTITVNGNYFGENGATLIEEVAYTLAQGVEYLNRLTEKGIAPKQIAEKMQFNLGTGNNYFFEVAKIRAIRILWNTILEQYKVDDSIMYIHSETSINNESEEDKNYDILRNTTRAMSAILGGCDSLTVNPHDISEKKLDFSNRIARNIQHLLKEEAFFDKVNNPADGSYYIEQLTDEIATKSWKLFQEIEEKGGFLIFSENHFNLTETA
jgi:methylmalonyl-CoA mutase